MRLDLLEILRWASQILESISFDVTKGMLVFLFALWSLQLLVSIRLRLFGMRVMHPQWYWKAACGDTCSSCMLSIQ